MISYLEYLMEKKKPKHEGEEEEEEKQNDRGVLHELMVHDHLVKKHGGVEHKYKDGRETTQEAHHRIATKLFGENYRSHANYHDMNEKAESAADVIRHHVGDNWEKGKSKVSWTSKHGDVAKITGRETHQADDPSDLYVSHKGGHLGVSLKTVQKKNGVAPLSNGGRGDVDKLLGIDTTHHIEAAKERVRGRHSILDGVTTAAQAKALIKANPELKADELRERKTALGGVANEYKEAFMKMKQENLGKFAHTLRRSMRAVDTGHAHIRLTSGGTGGDYSQKIENPVTQHDNILNDAANINASVTGNSVQFYHQHPVTGAITKFHSIRLKSSGSEGIFGSQKTSGANNPFKKPKSDEHHGETVSVSQNEPDRARPGMSNTLKPSATIAKPPRIPRIPKPKAAPKPKAPKIPATKPAKPRKQGGQHAGRDFYKKHEIEGE
jgi:hypothetical protein